MTAIKLYFYGMINAFSMLWIAVLIILAIGGDKYENHYLILTATALAYYGSYKGLNKLLTP